MDYLACACGVSRQFNTSEEAQAWLTEVGGGPLYVLAERLSAAEAESGRICQQRDDAEKERHDALERLAAANDLIAHLRISEAGYIDEYRKAKDKLAAAEADCNEFAAKILALRQEVFDAKRRLAAAEAFAAKHKCKTCGGILVSISELCSCDDDEAARAAGGGE